jgi:hypothetical protein
VGDCEEIENALLFLEAYPTPCPLPEAGEGAGGGVSDGEGFGVKKPPSLLRGTGVIFALSALSNFSYD